MKEVGDKFGAGELILPFVLQSAEVMKRAVARLENYLDRIEGYTKGTVVIATVFGDVHDIGKSLVNTILTNNGYTVVDLGKQVPIGTILDAAKEHDATAIGLSALLVSTSKQMPLAIQELHSAGPRVPGADRRRRDQPRLRPARAVPEAAASPTRSTRPASSSARTPSRAWPRWTRSSTARRAPRSWRRPAPTRSGCARRAPSPRRCRPTTTASARPRAPTTPVPEPPFWGVREIEVDLAEVYPHLDTHVLFKLHWGGRGVKGEAWKKLLAEDFQPRLERMWAEQDYLHPRALVGYFPCYSEGNDIVVLDPEDRAKELERFVNPRQPGHDRICLSDFYRPKRQRRARRRRLPGGHRRRRGHRADGPARDRRRVRRAAVRPRPRHPVRRGHGRVAARADPRRPRHPAHPGPPLLVGLPRGARAVRAREALPAARRAADRPAPVRRLRARARAVDGRRSSPTTPRPTTSA